MLFFPHGAKSISISSFLTFQVFECLWRWKAAGWQPGELGGFMDG